MMMMRRSVIYFYGFTAVMPLPPWPLLLLLAKCGSSQLFLGCRGLPGVQGCDWWTSHSVAISMYTFEICMQPGVRKMALAAYKHDAS